MTPPTAIALAATPASAAGVGARTHEPSCESLARDAQAGSRAAYSALVTRYEHRLYSFLLRRVSNRDDAAELAQETFVRAYTSLPRYDPERRFSTWLYTIAVRLAASHYRDRSRRPSLAEDPEILPHTHNTTSPDPDAREDASRVWTLARTLLSNEQQTALWLRYVEDLAIPEIAHVMNRPAVWVRVALFRARQRLAEALDPSASRIASEEPTP